jgi:predicted phosphodiesterase
MKVVIFSDTHLSNKFDLAQFEFIKGVVESVDQVIINGDFWDNYEATFDQFINSEWQKLFPLLKKKKTVYVYGNHDFQKFADERVQLFSDQQVEECSVKAGKYLLRVKHGHQIASSGDVMFPWLFGNNFTLGLMSRLQAVGVKLLGVPFLRAAFWFWAVQFKIYSRQLEKNEILVCGHAHLAELNLKKKYINTGVIRWGLGQYLLVENGKLEIVRKKYGL